MRTREALRRSVFLPLTHANVEDSAAKLLFHHQARGGPDRGIHDILDLDGIYKVSLVRGDEGA
jgi:hypothetical protein